MSEDTNARSSSVLHYGNSAGSPNGEHVVLCDFVISNIPDSQRPSAYNQNLEETEVYLDVVVATTEGGHLVRFPFTLLEEEQTLRSPDCRIPMLPAQIKLIGLYVMSRKNTKETPLCYTFLQPAEFLLVFSQREDISFTSALRPGVHDHGDVSHDTMSVTFQITVNGVSSIDRAAAHIVHHDIVKWLNSDRYELEDLDQALAGYTEARDLLPQSHPWYHRAMDAIGICKVARGVATDDLSEITAGICLQQDALCALQDAPQSAGRGSKKERLKFLLGLISSFDKRWEISGSAVDLAHMTVASEERLRLQRELGQISEERFLYRSISIMFMRHSVGRASVDEVAQLVACLEEEAFSSNIISLGARPEHEKQLFFLSEGWYLLHWMTKNLAYIMRAVRWAEEGVLLTSRLPDSDEQLAKHLHNLGKYLFAATHYHFADPGQRPGMLNRSIETLRRALDYAMASQADHRTIVGIKSKLADAFLHREGVGDLQVALAQGRAIAMNTKSLSAYCRRAAVIWLFAALRTGDVAETKMAYRVFIQLTQEREGLGGAIRNILYSPSKSLGGTLVVRTLDLGDVGMAVEMFEQQRCRVWSQLLSLQTPVDDLRSKHPDLAGRFKRVARALQAAGTHGKDIRTATPRTLMDSTGMVQFRERDVLGMELGNILEEIRSQPEFSTFFQPLDVWEKVDLIPPGGYIVLCHVDDDGRCDALVVEAGKEAIHVAFNNQDEDSGLRAKVLSDLLEERLEIHGARVRQVASRALCWEEKEESANLTQILVTLWHNFTKPIIDALKISPAEDPSSRPRLWWCPAGPLAFLPLHAAGIYGDDAPFGSCISDYVVSSYTPSIESLVAKVGRTPRISADETIPAIVLVNQPNTPGLAPIPGTVEETTLIKGLMKDAGIHTTLIEGEHATKERVLAAMKTNSWTHLACHATQNTDDALQSGVHVHDGRLALEAIIGEGIPHAEHIFLSACQTSAGDKKLPEEVIHVAAGMLAIGYRGVVGSMWSIKDCHGPRVAADFYKELLRRSAERDGTVGLVSEDSAVALDYAVSKLRESLGNGEQALVSWVPYVHFGV